MPKAFRFYVTGGPDVLKWEDTEVPSPGPGQVRIRHTAVAVNYRDILVRNGSHSIKLPSGIGLEGAGVVEAIGAQVSDLKIGDRVVCVSGPDGAYAEARLVPASRVIKLPDNISDRLAAGMMIRGMTARYLVRETYCVEPGSRISCSCGGWRRRNHFVPVGQAPWGNRDWSGRQQGENCGRAWKWMRPRH